MPSPCEVIRTAETQISEGPDVENLRKCMGRVHKQTRVYFEGDDLVVRLAKTNIVTLCANGDVIFSSGG